MIKENKLNENVLEFKLREGKDSGSNGGNWLVEMKKGTRFLAFKKSMPDSRASDFIVASDPKGEFTPAVLLGESPGDFRFHDPVKFVRDYECYMILEVVEMKHGNSNKIHEGTVATDGGPEGTPSLSKEE